MATVSKILGVLKQRVIEIYQLRVTNQTFVHRFQDQDVNLTAGQPEVIPYNVPEEDNLGEFSGGTFTPEETAHYQFNIHMEFGVDSNQDELKIDLFNTDTNQTEFESEIRANGTGNRDRGAHFWELLEAGVGYQIRATNEDNDDTVNGKPKRTRLGIRLLPESQLPY